jgi:hypothetical protein
VQNSFAFSAAKGRKDINIYYSKKNEGLQGHAFPFFIVYKKFIDGAAPSGYDKLRALCIHGAASAANGRKQKGRVGVCSDM